MNRRTFITSTSLSALTAAIPAKIFSAFAQKNDDEQICVSKFDFAVSKKLAEKPINEVIVEIGKSFLGVEYAAHTLEDDGDEKLIINLRALDCVTFYENCLVLARCIKFKKTTFEDYKAQLQFIRYRNGKIDGYASRLHYTTDYWYDAEQKGVLKVVTKEIFGEKNVVQIPKPINFMTAHRTAYKHLAANSANFEKIKAMENELNKRESFFLPKGNVHMFADTIMSGDLLGITTNVEGMDIAHTGVALRTEDGVLRFMHAPNVGHKVQITETSLHDYLAKNGKQTGIIVARVNEV